MIRTGKSFILRIVCGCITILSACSSHATNVPSPVEITFESQSQATVGGIRLAPGENQWDGYGEAIDVYGDVAAIGASDWNQLGPGSVYVYRFMGGGWAEEAQLIASDRELFMAQASADGGQRFGASVAVGEGIIVVGAPGSVQSGSSGYHGAVYVFAHQENGWTETLRLTPGRFDHIAEETQLNWLEFSRMKPRAFGSHVALSGDTLAVGGDADGTVYIYKRGGNGWDEWAQITIPASPERDLYVTSMSLLDGTLAVSALYLPSQLNPDSFLTGTVAVYLFEQAGTSWEESFRFIPDDATADYIFPGAIHVGASVSLGGGSGAADLLAVGLPGWPDWSGDLDESQIGLSQEQISEFADFGVSSRRSGEVYIFGRDDEGRWQQHATLQPTGWDNPPGPGSFTSFIPPDFEQLNADEKANFYSAFVFPGHIFSAAPEITFFGATVDLDGSRLAVTSGFANSTYLFEEQQGQWIHRLHIKPRNVKAEFWEDYTRPVVVSGHTLLLGTPGEFGNSVYVFDLCEPAMLDCR